MDLDERAVELTTLEKEQHRPVEEPRRTFTALSDTSTVREVFLPSPILPRLEVNSASGLCRTNSCASSSDDIPGIVAIPEPNEASVRRMRWILQTSMESVLATVSPEQRKVLEGTTDLTQLIVVLFQSWDQFRSIDVRAGKSRKFAKSMCEKMKSTLTMNELSESFWSRKQSIEREDASWRGFKKFVLGLLDQMVLIDKVLNSLNQCHVSVLMTLLRTVPSSRAGDIRGRLSFPKGTSNGCQI